MLGLIQRGHLLVALTLTLGAASGGLAQAPELEQKLNDRLFGGTVSESTRSAKTIFDAFVELTAPPMEVGGDFNLTTIWPGMVGWESVSNWAASNEQMGEALIEAQGKIILGMPYGQSRVDRNWRMKDIYSDIAPNGDLSVIDYPYLHVGMDTIACWATAEFYRLLEAKEHEKAFDLGLAFLRVLRQGCEQEMLEEKVWFMDTLSDALSIQRDGMYAYRDSIPPALFKKLGTKEYPFLKPTDDERMRRLKMPEGDRLVAEAMIEATFDDAGQADGQQFADVFGALQAREAPLTRFGTKRRWMRLSAVHASYDASKEKLTDVYDDWWRRWRFRQFDPVMDLPTEFSRLNEIRFAAIILTTSDLEQAFRSRERLIANINGTIISSGVCGYYATFNNEWPATLAPVYSVFAIKRFDFDPFDKGYGRFVYRFLNARRSIDTDYGQLWLEGCMLYAVGLDHADGGGVSSSVDGAIDDMLLWPPARQVAREEGKLD
jgi:hypothetical protein